MDLATGADLPASPVVIAAPDFDPLMENQRPALMLANGMVYVGYASHCDKEPYHGFLTGIRCQYPVAGERFEYVAYGLKSKYLAICQGPAADEDGNVFVVTGNGSWDGVTILAQSFLKLTPQLKLIDWFTPTNHFDLDRRDEDLNSSGATLIPGTHLVLGGGKGGVRRSS